LVLIERSGEAFLRQKYKEYEQQWEKRFSHCLITPKTFNVKVAAEASPCMPVETRILPVVPLPKHSLSFRWL